MGFVPLPSPTPRDLAKWLLADLKRIAREDRDLRPGEWFRLARRFVRARHAVETGQTPHPCASRHGFGLRSKPPPPASED